MRLPFSQAQFFDNFAAYNTALWPVVVAVWVITAGFATALIRRRVHSPALTMFVAFHWAWEGVAYHAVYFSRINPAAWLFAVLFLAEALLLLWIGVLRHGFVFDWGNRLRHVLAGAFIAYSLLYPLFTAVSGHIYPRSPVYAVPCPTALFTTAMLLAIAPPVPRWLFVVPAIWGIVGGSAALLLGMTPDLMLFVAAGALLVYALDPASFDRPLLRYPP